MTLSRTAAFRLLAASLVVTFAAAAVAVFGVIPALWVVVALGIIAFWVAIAQLIADAGRRVRSALRDVAAQFAAAAADRGGSGRRPDAPVELGELKRLD